MSIFTSFRRRGLQASLLLSLIFSAQTAFGQATWQSLSNEGFTARGDYAIAAAADLGAAGRVYTFGGRMFTGSENILFNVIEYYDVATKRWNKVEYTGTMAKRMWHDASYVGGKFYITSGFEGAFATTTTLVEVFDPVTLTVEPVAVTGAVPALYGVTATTVANGKIYIFGGFNFANTDGANADVNIFDPATKTWETKTPTGVALPANRTNLAATTIGDDILITGGLGGESGYETFNVAHKYSVSTNEVTLLTPLITSLHNHASVNVEGKIYFIGGQTDIAGTPNMSPFIYDASAGSEPYQYLFAAGEYETNSGNASVAIGRTIYQLGGGFMLSGTQLPHQALMLDGPSTVANEQTKSLQVSVSADRITISADRSIQTTELVDLLGSVRIRSEPAASQTSINTDGLASGMYFVKCQTDLGISVVKVMIK